LRSLEIVQIDSLSPWWCVLRGFLSEDAASYLAGGFMSDVLDLRPGKDHMFCSYAMYALLLYARGYARASLLSPPMELQVV